MTRKTLELIIAIIAFFTEILVIVKDKLKNGRKGNDDKGVSKKE